MTAKKFVYAYDLTQDMTTLSAYFQTRRLKLSRAKTLKIAFDLYIREVKRLAQGI